MELSLFEANVDVDGGVFVLYLPTHEVKAGEHIDRILSVLHILTICKKKKKKGMKDWLEVNVQMADRKGICESFENFVAGLTPGQFVKFKVLSRITFFRFLTVFILIAFFSSLWSMVSSLEVIFYFYLFVFFCCFFWIYYYLILFWFVSVNVHLMFIY